MSDENTVLGLTERQQLVLIVAVGAVLLVAGLRGSSAVTPTYDPLLTGVGGVMLVYAGVRGAWNALFK